MDEEKKETGQPVVLLGPEALEEGEKIPVPQGGELCIMLKAGPYETSN